LTLSEKFQWRSVSFGCIPANPVNKCHFLRVYCFKLYDFFFGWFYLCYFPLSFLTPSPLGAFFLVVLALLYGSGDTREGHTTTP